MSFSIGSLPRIAVCIAIFCLAARLCSVEAEPLQSKPAQLDEGSSWTRLELGAGELPSLPERLDEGTFWDLRPARGSGRAVEWHVRTARSAGLRDEARQVGADLALCAELPEGRSLGCALFDSKRPTPGEPTLLWSDLAHRAAGVRTVHATDDLSRNWTAGMPAVGLTVKTHDSTRSFLRTVVAEGLALTPAGPFEVVVARERIVEQETVRLRFRFVSTSGFEVARLEGPLPATGNVFAFDRAEVLGSPAPEADNGLEIRYSALSSALMPGTILALQYSLVDDTVLSSVQPSWTSVATMVSPSASTSYQPDPGDPGSSESLPEVWDFSSLLASNLTYRTVYTTRDDSLSALCLDGTSCAIRCPLSCPVDCPPECSGGTPDGSWQVYLKADGYDPLDALFTHDVFTLNVNDTGANPSIDMPFASLDDQNTDDWSQICFDDSPGASAADRLHSFFKFTGPDPASAVLSVGDTWTTGDWSACNASDGLHVSLASSCGDGCFSVCSIQPYARGLIGGNAGLRMTIVEDGWIQFPTGNYIPSVLLRQDTDIEAGRDLFGTCNAETTPNRTFDYFWVNEDYGLLASVSSPGDPVGTMLPDDWSVVGNVTDGADFTWGPFPPHETRAQACLSGTRIEWALPLDGSNIGAEPGISDYGYVVSWGSDPDPDVLADWAGNPNHTALPGEAGYLAAPAGSEPTSTIITSWAGSSINATVVTALNYTDPDVSDVRVYQSASIYKVVEDPARLDPGTFVIGNGVDPLVSKNGGDFLLSWPAVSGAESYLVRVWDLPTRTEIPCPAGMDCQPTLPTTTSPAGPENLAFRAFAVDACAEASSN